MGELAPGVRTQDWGTNGLPSGQPQATWYDRYGRSFVLPADSYSIVHYQDRGLTLHPPESPESLAEDNDWSEGSANATRGGPIIEEAHEELFGGLPSPEPQRKGRGPDKKKRKRRKKRRNRA